MKLIKMALKIKWRFLFLCVCLEQIDKGWCSQEIMEKLTVGFTKVLDECKKELNLGGHIMEDFVNYWHEDYELLNRDLGCAIMCMASKHDLITDELKLHKEKTHEFVKSHGADDELAKQLVKMIHDCEKGQPESADDCMRTLEISKCFRKKIHELKWAPSMETVLQEIMTDI